MPLIMGQQEHCDFSNVEKLDKWCQEFKPDIGPFYITHMTFQCLPTIYVVIDFVLTYPSYEVNQKTSAQNKHG